MGVLGSEYQTAAILVEARMRDALKVMRAHLGEVQRWPTDGAGEASGVGLRSTVGEGVPWRVPGSPSRNSHSGRRDPSLQ